MGHTGTEKKNPFVMTIGFDKNDPEHVEVAEFLNSLPRKKAQYIVEAVRCYRQIQQDGSPLGTGDWREQNQGEDNWIEGNRGENTGKLPDKEAIRQIVLQIMAEWEENMEKDVWDIPLSHGTVCKQAPCEDWRKDDLTRNEVFHVQDIEADAISGLEQVDLGVIFESLEALRGDGG